jgi:Fuc2NAc and GlcNAc transferase
MLCSWLASLALTHYAPQWGLLHTANSRSSHIDATPHGGGIAVTLTFFCAVLGAHALYKLPPTLVLSLLGGGGLVWAISLWDDFHPLPVAQRLCTHSLAALGAILLLRTPVAQDSGPIVQLCVTAITIVILVWWLNLFNFMDGIDGLAASEALFISAAAALLLWLADANGYTIGAPQWRHPLLLLLSLLSAASAGFLLTNWSPARIFMGDVGSTYLGFAIGVLALTSIVSGHLPSAAWLILGGVFWVDSTTTLLRRMIRGESWGQAHREHAYQRYTDGWYRHYQQHSSRRSSAVPRTRAHRAVCLSIAAINLLWLLPLAWLAIIGPAWSALIVIVAWAPLLLLTIRSPRFISEEP